MPSDYKLAGHCRRYANLRADEAGDYEVEYGVCLSVAQGGVSREVGVGVFEKDIRRAEVKMVSLS